MRYTLLCVVLSLPAVAGAQSSAKEWLDKMSNAVHALNYEGTFVFMRGGQTEAMHIIHGKDGEGIRERLVSLTGDKREVIRDQGVLTCILANTRSVVVETNQSRHSLPATLPMSTEEFAEHYTFELGEKGRFADRECQYAIIEPRDALRYGYRLCMELDTGLLLKSEMLDASGQSVESFMFTNLTLHDSIPSQRFQPTLDSDTYTWHTVGAHEPSLGLEPDLSWQFADLPQGFAVRENVKRAIAASPLPVQHMIVSDGLASVSVFIATAPAGAADGDVSESASRSGALHAYIRFMNDHQVTVVGEVPEQTVKLIGRSLAYNVAANN
ncbi:MAG: MucB/RseB C-terminal domain-containing protein [Gammaproteobacteria bacterium]